MTTLWAIYLTVCIGNTCAVQEVQRFDEQPACEAMLPSYTPIPIVNADTVEWQCRPVGSTGT